MTKLVFSAGPLADRRFDVGLSLSVGRDGSNDVVIPDSTVSLVHCRIYTKKGSVFVTDLGSTNGTHVNGTRVITAELHDGDGLAIGSSRIRVECSDSGREPGFAAVEDTVKVGAEEAESAEEPDDGGKNEDPGLSGSIFGTVTYDLKRKIASGGMGSIFEADQFGAEGFIKKVAIKTILPRFARKTTFVSSFVGEARLVANLVHQNIVQIHHLGRHEDGYFIAMEYINGVNLSDFMLAHWNARRSVPLEIATYIASRICRGLEYAHSKRDEAGNLLGLVHRDVCPNNIMISREGEVKLTDFGVAKAAQFMEAHEDYLIGSVEYMSPEQAACDPVDSRSDLFSLGLVYFELLTGRRIFQCHDGDIEGTLEIVKACNIPDPRKYRQDIPRSTVEILSKCLQRMPDDRHQTAGELGYTLEYEIYSKGYGPTIVTMSEYLDDLMKDGH